MPSKKSVGVPPYPGRCYTHMGEDRSRTIKFWKIQKKYLFSELRLPNHIKGGPCTKVSFGHSVPSCK